MYVLIVLLVVRSVVNLPEKIHIGGLFQPNDEKQEIAFKYAIDKINLDRSILPNSKLTSNIEIISPYDSFRATKKGKKT